MRSGRKPKRVRIVPAPERRLPLPQGEGWGEGEERIARLPRVRNSPIGFKAFTLAMRGAREHAKAWTPNAEGHAEA